MKTKRLVCGRCSAGRVRKIHGSAEDSDTNDMARHEGSAAKNEIHIKIPAVETRKRSRKHKIWWEKHEEGVK